MDSEVRFEKYLPEEYKEISLRHWSGYETIKFASEFLCAHKKGKILDIGSGAGKFCVLGAILFPKAFFTGIEIRKEFIAISNQQKVRFDVSNCNFRNTDMREVDFSEFTGFYFFNSFLEFIDPTAKIDENSHISKERYMQLSNTLFTKLAATKEGTRLVTFHCSKEIIPSSFRLVSTHGSQLKCYIKDNSEKHEPFNAVYLNKYIDRVLS